jgi:mannan endo-1,4-beta-mannosidase
MRCAGIHTPLVIDVSDFGKGLEVFNASAAALLEADPDHNLIFSVHLYWGIDDGADAQFISDMLDAAVAEDYPLIVGEFSGTAAASTVAASTTRPSSRRPQNWASAGTPGNGAPSNIFGGEGCDVLDMTPDRLFAHLRPGWATEVAVTSPFSIANTSSPIL